MSATFYHLTALHLVDAIKREGLTRGLVPWSNDGRRVELRPGFQWLTTNPKWQQEWANEEFSSLPYSRTAVRFTVEIPPLFHKRALKWLNFCKGNALRADLNAFGDPWNWRVYRGGIPPEWLVQMHERKALEVAQP